MTMEMRCTLCNALWGQCDCWVRCECGWSYEKGTQCSNRTHQNPKSRFYQKSAELREIKRERTAR